MRKAGVAAPVLWRLVLCCSCAFAWFGCVDDGGVAVRDAGEPDISVDGEETSRSNHAPTVRISAPGQIHVREEVQLDGTASSDRDGDRLRFRWSVVTAPPGSAASIAENEEPKTSFEPDVEGTYQFELAVSDGEERARDDVAISVFDRAPSAEAGDRVAVRIGEVVALDASASSDPDGDPLEFVWSFVETPSKTSAKIRDANRAAASFTPDVEGDYTLEVEVSDGYRSATDRVTVTVSPSSPESIVYLRASGNDQNPGTEAFPVATFDKAMAIAAETSSVERIDVGSSRFDASSGHQISKKLTIVGDGPSATILDATGASAFEIGNDRVLSLNDLAVVRGRPAVTVEEGSQLTTSGWRCEGGGTCVAAGEFFGSPGGRVSLNRSELIGDGTEPAVEINNEPLLATKVTIRGFAQGVANAGARMRIRDSTIESCDQAIEGLTGTSNPIRLFGSTFRSNEIGVRLTAAEDVTVRNSTFAQHTSRAIELNAGSTLVFRSSTVEESSYSGILVKGGSVLTLDGGEIRKNGFGNPSRVIDRAGILFEDDAVLNGNAGGTVIHDNGRDNLVFVDAARGTLTRLDVYGGKAGVYAKTSGRIRVDQGVYERNENGFYIDGGTELRITGAQIARNTKNGIHYRGSGGLFVRRSTLRSNGRYQIQVQHTAPTLDLGTASSPGGNLFRNSSSSRFAIYDSRPGVSSAMETVLRAAGNTYQSGNFALDFATSSVAGQTFQGPTTYENASAGDTKAVFEIENANQRIGF